MLKILLVVVVIIGAAWGYPPTRAHMSTALVPVVERLGPVGRALKRPMQRYSARTEISFILDQIDIHRTEGRPLPTDQTFQKWMADRVKTKQYGRDIWGNPYFLTKTTDGFIVGSNGPDGERGTEDDITKTSSP